MNQHSMIIDDFFDHPYRTREMLLECEIIDHKADDGVTYPGIIKLPEVLDYDIQRKLNYLFQNRLESALNFARYSMSTMTPPNWAHSDYNMTQFVGLIYMNPNPRPDDGTWLVKHKLAQFETHPATDEQKEILLRDSNDKHLWSKTFFCPAKFNRIFIINAEYLHAAGPSYGTNRDNSRLVVTSFFTLKS